MMLLFGRKLRGGGTSSRCGVEFGIAMRRTRTVQIRSPVHRRPHPAAQLCFALFDSSTPTTTPLSRPPKLHRRPEYLEATEHEYIHAHPRTPRLQPPTGLRQATLNPTTTMKPVVSAFNAWTWCAALLQSDNQDARV